MTPINLLDARDRDELRRWLEKNHATEKECWVAVKRGKPAQDGTFAYIDAVEERRHCVSDGSTAHAKNFRTP